MVPRCSISAPFCCWSVPGTTLLWEKFVFIQTTTFPILPFFHHSRYPFLISFIICVYFISWLVSDPSLVLSLSLRHPVASPKTTITTTTTTTPLVLLVGSFH